MTSAVVLLLTIAIVAPPWILFTLVKRVWLVRLEERVLWQKYGDLPMFQRFFEREGIRPRPSRRYLRSRNP